MIFTNVNTPDSLCNRYRIAGIFSVCKQVGEPTTLLPCASAIWISLSLNLICWVGRVSKYFFVCESNFFLRGEKYWVKSPYAFYLLCVEQTHISVEWSWLPVKIMNFSLTLKNICRITRIDGLFHWLNIDICDLYRVS